MAYLNTQHPTVRSYNPQGCVGCSGLGDSLTNFVTSPTGLLLGAAAAWFFLFRKKRG